MNKRHTPEQIVRMLREAEAKLAAGSSVPEIARELGISEATFHRWKARYGTMSSQECPNSWQRVSTCSFLLWANIWG
jgi:transposase